MQVYFMKIFMFYLLKQVLKKFIFELFLSGRSLDVHSSRFTSVDFYFVELFTDCGH